MPVIADTSSQKESLREVIERNAANLGITDGDEDSADAAPAEEPQEVAEEPAQSTASAEEPVEAPRGPGRPKGSKNKPKEPEVAAATEELGQDADLEEQESEGEAEAPQSLEPYEFWPAEVKRDFAKVPREVQEGLLRHEQTRSAWANRLQQERNEASTYRKEVESAVPDEVRKLMPFMGVKNEAEILRRATGWIQAEQSDPYLAAMTYIQRLGFTPQDLMNGPQLAQQSSQEYGAGSALPPEIQEKLREVDELKAWRESQATEMLNSELQSFYAETDESGEVRGNKIPYYEPHMAQVIELIKAEYPGTPRREMLRQAYDIVDRHFTQRFVAPKLQAKQQVTAQHTEKAKKAASAMVSGAPISVSQSAPKDLRAKIEFYANQLGI